MGFGGVLPKALTEQWPFYYDGRTLHVTVNRRTLRNVSDGEVVVGAYAIGKIWLYPCPRCTDGFLTHTFLHELCHAWMDAFHRSLSLSDEACALCCTFADRSLELLGGGRRSEMKCWSCRLPNDIGPRRLRRFQEYADLLAKADSAAIQRLMKQAAARMCASRASSSEACTFADPN
ncbi:MAG: hypothetical protein AB7S71_06900 [Dongiaceae bacterium]